MSILVIAEHDNNTLATSTLNTVQAASAFEGQVHVLVTGQNCNNIAVECSSLEGVEKVLLCQAEHYQHQLAEEIANLIVNIAEPYKVILAGSTTTGKNIIPRLAALLGVQPLSDVISVESESIFKRPIYAGNVIATVECLEAIKVLTVRTTAFDAVGKSGSQCEISEIDALNQLGISSFVSEQLAASDRPDLTSAKVVISGGRGLGKGENFDLLYQLADKLGAAVGASRAAVDAGFVPNDMQVGQTGKIVAPDLYIAIGISGAIQHLAGMKESKVIVAINNDPEAPIFQVADYGLVADLFTVVPEIIQKLD